MLHSAYLGVPGIPDVQYAFFDASNTLIGAWATSGVTDAGQGWYTVDVARPVGSASIRWESLSNSAINAREYFSTEAGPSTIGLRFVDAFGAGIANVKFTVVGYGAGSADVNGQASFSIQNGNYTLAAAAPGYVFQNVPLNVEGNTVLTVSAVALPTPADGTAFADFYDVMRTILGDRRVHGVWNYSDEQFDSAIRTTFILGEGPDGYSLSGNQSDAVWISPAVTNATNFALIAYNSCLRMLTGEDGEVRFATRGLSVFDKGDRKSDLLFDIRQQVYELRNGDVFFDTIEQIVQGAGA